MIIFNHGGFIDSRMCFIIGTRCSKKDILPTFQVLMGDTLLAILIVRFGILFISNGLTTYGPQKRKT